MRHRLLVLVTAFALLATCSVSPRAPVDDAGPEATTSPVAGPTEGPADPPRPTAPPTLVMWARDGLPSTVARRAAQLPGVVVATHVRSATVGLVGARRADGTTVTNLGDGWRIPVQVVAVTPRPAARTLPEGDDRQALARLRPGEVLLSATSAARRGVAGGGHLDLSGGARLRVAGVVADGTLGGGELIAHAADAPTLGAELEGSVLLAHDGRREPGFTRRLEALAPDGTRVRVVGARPDEAPRRASLVLDLTEVKARFGEFAFRDDSPDREIYPERAWIRDAITVEEVPILGRVRCHRDIFDDLRAALQAVVDAGLASEIDPSEYGGCYHPRRIGAGSESLSRHSWGIAIDINVDFSEPGMGPPPDPRVIRAFTDAGFQWGGLFLSPDNHHFEWAGTRATTDPPTPGTGAAPEGTTA